MARVTGIGGVFLRSSDPPRLALWYAEHLGIVLADPSSAMLPWPEEVPAGTGTTVWAAFPQDTNYFGPDKNPPQAVMVNYRVDDLDALLEKLAGASVWIEPKREVYPYGRFAWIQDCDGNRLELWQPVAEG